MLVDSHCHIHSNEYELNADEVIEAANAANVTKLIVVGTDMPDSKRAVKFAKSRENIWASVGLHPHDAKLGQVAYEELAKLVKEDVVAIGECGLDYYYNHSSKEDQAAAFRFQLALAQEHDLPMIFHVRDAFKDFWPIVDEYPSVRGVVHSFTADQKEMEEALQRNLYIGLNGIMTFSKGPGQIEMAKTVPLKSLLLETDAPFLTPAPFRGKINQPKQILVIAKFLSDLRNESLEELSNASTKNAEKLFSI